MSKIRELLRIFDKNPRLSERKIARALDISRPVVHQWLSDFKKSNLTYSDIEKLKDDDLINVIKSKKRKINKKYEILASKFKYFSKELTKNGVTLHTLWEEYKNDHPDGYSRSRFNYHFQVWKSQTEVSMAFNHKAGDKMFVDFAGKKLHITDRITGIETQVETFIAILGASQYTYVEVVDSQKKHDFISATENAFIFFNGVTNAVVPDSLKSGVKKACKYEPDINPDYADFARHYDTVILPARPYCSKDKALVENAVRLVYWWIYAPLRNRIFYSIEELNQAILIELEKYNNKKMQRTGLSRKQLFEETDEKELNPLPVNNYELKTFLVKTVPYNYHIYISEDKHYYSVPYIYKGQKINIIYTKRVFEAYYKNQRISFHKRVKTNGYMNKYSTHAHHMPPNHRFVSGWSPEKFIKWGQSIGESVKIMVEKILLSKKHPEQAYKVCMGLLNLTKKYSKLRLENACRRALSFNYYSYKGVKKILENNMDNNIDNEPDLFSNFLPVHENIRGNKYYN